MYFSCCGQLGLSQCHRSGMPPTLGSRSSRLLLIPASLRNSVRFRCIIDAKAPRLAVSSSFGAIIGNGNVIAAAAAVAGCTGGSHAGVSSALAHVAVTAVAIASGACLSTKVDFLWPRLEDQPGIGFCCLIFESFIYLLARLLRQNVKSFCFNNLF